MATQTLEAYYDSGAGNLSINPVAYGGSSGIGAVTLAEVGSTGIYRGSRSGTDTGGHVGRLLVAADSSFTGLVYHFHLANADGTYRGQTNPIDQSCGKVSEVTGNINTASGTIQTLDELALRGAPLALQATTIATLTSQVVGTLTAGSADDDAYNDCLLVIVDQSTAVQKAVAYIVDYVGSTKAFKLLAAPLFTIAAGDKVYVVKSDAQVRCLVAAQLTSGDGDAVDVAAWLDLNGVQQVITGATCSIEFREQSGAALLFPALTDSGAPLASPVIYRNAFRLTKATPGFTDDTIVLVEAAITINGRTFTGFDVIPVMGA